ncbi:PDZ domain-containing protein [Parachryseolinea silvisoli]|uniref:PDZ domain-containing protein n=1 Tax=Parachryseolinea silvisoli TaxID=2873601 RepID=UPI00226587B2|nr:PDZ domain-containing protein [Parachryseolinea silvisoli]MCD9016062.1 hypothetical protein [Parachryseolinea silvisoli]
MNLLQSLLLIAILNLVYQAGFFVMSRWLRVSNDHYFLGYGRSLFTFRAGGVKFSMGWYIPIFFLARIYTVTDGQKSAMIYPWEFANRTLGRRLLATWGGAMALIFFAWTFFTYDAFVKPYSVITREDVNRYGIEPNQTAKEAGFRSGDKILQINSREYELFDDLIKPTALLPNGAVYTVQRGDSVLDITISPQMAKTFVPDPENFRLSLRMPFEVLSVIPGTPADAAAIQPGDLITKANGREAILSLDNVHNERYKGTDTVLLEIERIQDGRTSVQTKYIVMPETLAKDGAFVEGSVALGIKTKLLFSRTHRSRTFFQAAGEGVSIISKFFTSSLRGISQVTYKASRSEIEPIAITPAIRSFAHHVSTRALIVWIYNILPLPYSLFWETIALFYEGITWKKYPESLFRWSWIAGLVVFVAFVLFTFVKDLLALF